VVQRRRFGEVLGLGEGDEDFEIGKSHVFNVKLGFILNFIENDLLFFACAKQSRQKKTHPSFTAYLHSLAIFFTKIFELAASGSNKRKFPKNCKSLRRFRWGPILFERYLKCIMSIYSKVRSFLKMFFEIKNT
jgi:hypothetical protein